ncbi:hypothetical protein D915_009177 [Fasciola hepatica]|uniref:Uncharacterized protein n=1 Tax=Fasciola hepatica TaxID=6192 RepID=A0A4E0RV47_FASHE|nr:hypothetical protein D915_009177 [Fasciola hepatica]
MGDSRFTVDDKLFGEVFKKEAEWKGLLVREIQDMSLKYNETQEKLDTTTNQLNQLKEAFFDNFKLLNMREAEFTLQKDELVAAKKNLHSREMIISELKASIDRCETEVRSYRNVETQLRQELELQRAESIKRESELHNKHSITLNAIKQSEAQERAQLQSALTRIQADLEAERIKAVNDLEEVLSRTAEQAEKSALEASQKQFGLQLRVQMLEEMYERTLKAKKEALADVESKEKYIAKVQSELQVALQTVESLTLNITEARIDKEIAEQKMSAAENAKIRAQHKWNEERNELLNKLESTKSQLEWQRKEMAIALSKREEERSETEAENQRVLESLAKEQEETRKALQSLAEANEIRQLAERNARTMRSECERLRQDLEQALLTQVRNEPKVVASCDHKHLFAQLERLQNSCDRLEEENTRLKRSISVMSEQAKRTAQLSKTTGRDERQKKLDKSTVTFTVENAEKVDGEDHEQTLREKLQMSVRMIRKLAQEKNALKELSNRLQARIYQLETNRQVDASERARQLPEVRCSLDKSPYARNNDSYRSDLFEVPTNEHDGCVAKPYVPSLPLIDPDDAVSSVQGRESVSALFHLVDANAPTTDIRWAISDRPSLTELQVRGRSKPIRPAKCVEPL